MSRFILQFVALIFGVGALFNPCDAAAESVAAKVSPKETVAFGEIHDLQRTLKRWKETALYQITQEAEWKAFTAKLGGLLDSVPQIEKVRGVLAEIEKAGPSGAFIALGEVPNVSATVMPKLLGGASFNGADQAKALFGSLRAKFEEIAEVKSAKITVDGVEFESVAIGDVGIAFLDKWIFAATDKQLLLDAISRYSGKSPPGLASTDPWKNAAKSMLEEPDMTGFILYQALLDTIARSGDADAGMFAAMSDFMPESLVVTAKLDGRGMRERAYSHYKKGVLPKPEGAHRSLAFSGENTYAYLEADYAGWVEPYGKMLAALPIPPIPQLEENGLELADIFKVFGPELVILSDWQPGGLALPTAFLAVEMRDVAKGRKFAEVIARLLASEKKLVEKEENGTRLWTMDLGIPVVKPTLAVNDKHLMFGLNPDSVLAPLKRAKDGKESLAQNATFTSALKSVAEPNGGMFYLDTKKLFERLYDRGRPFIANAIISEEKVAKYLDAGLLPKTETFSQHLLPMIVSFHMDEDGYLMESNGPTTYLTSTSMLAIGAGLALPAFSAVRTRGMEVQAMANARAINIAAKAYAVDHNGVYPKKLEDLVPQYLDNKKALLSPFAPKDPEIAYEVVEAKETDDGAKVWLKSKFKTRAGKRVTATVDGRILSDGE